MQVYIYIEPTLYFIIPGTLPTLNLPMKSHYQGSYFFRCNFSIKVSWLQKRGNKTNTILYARYYLQNHTNRTKYK